MLNDKCVICGKVTSVPNDTPVEMRNDYVVGCGQLCRDCYYELYNKSGAEGNTLSTEEELERLLKMCIKE